MFTLSPELLFPADDVVVENPGDGQRKQLRFALPYKKVGAGIRGPPATQNRWQLARSPAGTRVSPQLLHCIHWFPQTRDL